MNLERRCKAGRIFSLEARSNALLYYLLGLVLCGNSGIEICLFLLLSRFVETILLVGEFESF